MNLLITARPYHHILDLRCADPVTAHVDDIIKTASDLVITLLRAIGAIPSEEVTYGHKDDEILSSLKEKNPKKELKPSYCTRIRLTVGLNEPLVVVVDRSGHARPRLSYAQGSGSVVRSHHFPL